MPDILTITAMPGAGLVAEALSSRREKSHPGQDSNLARALDFLDS